MIAMVLRTVAVALLMLLLMGCARSPSLPIAPQIRYHPPLRQGQNAPAVVTRAPPGTDGSTGFGAVWEKAPTRPAQPEGRRLFIT